MLQAFEGAVNGILQNARETVSACAVLDVGSFGPSTPGNVAGCDVDVVSVSGC